MKPSPIFPPSRQHACIFFQVAFHGILQRAQAAGTVSEEELARFWQALEQAEQEQRFFARVGGFVVSGRKPA